MKYLIALALLMTVGCTSFHYQSPDGRSISFVSFKEYESIDADIKKDGDKVTAKLQVRGVSTEVVEEVTGAVIKGMGISSGASVIKDVAKGIVKKRMIEKGVVEK